MTPQAMIETRLAKGLDDIKKGRVRGPFESRRGNGEFAKKVLQNTFLLTQYNPGRPIVNFRHA